MGSFILIATRNLILARRRTLLIGLAIMVVTALLVGLRAAGRSVSERMIEAATTLSAGHVNIGGFYKFRRKGITAIVADRDAIKEVVRATIPDATAVIDRSRGWGRIISHESSINVGLNGITYDEESAFFASLRLAKPSEYETDGGNKPAGSFTALKNPNSILLFAGQAKKLGVGVGDNLSFVTEASGGQTNTVDLTVGAVAADIGFMSNWSVFVPRQTVIDLYRIDNKTTGVVMVYLKDITKATAAMMTLREALKAKGFEIMDHDPNPFFMKFDKVSGEDWLGQKLDLTIWSDEISFILWVTTAIDLVTFFVLGILAIIIGGGIANSMWMAVRERTKEIGTMRALGLQKSQVATLFMLEALILGVSFALLGSLLGAAVILIVNSLALPIGGAAQMFLMTNTLRLSLGPEQILFTVIIFGGIAALAALFPALRAARLRPVEALMRSK